MSISNALSDLAWDRTEGKAVVLIGATNRPDSLDAALRRAGRFDHEICMNVPDEEGRAQYVCNILSMKRCLIIFIRILRVLCSKLRLSGDFDFDALASQTPGYVGADLSALTGAAGIIAVKRIFQEIADGKIILPASIPDSEGRQDSNRLVGLEITEADGMVLDEPVTVNPEPAGSAEMCLEPPPATEPSTLTSLSTTSSIARFLQTYPNPLTPAQLSPLHITYADFLAALPSIQPSSTREGFASVPRVSWDDVGALAAIRDELHMAIVQPIRHPALFAAVGISAPAGVLLWGPPGCGKTLLAKAVASESRANFISVKGPELLNKVPCVLAIPPGY
jgi:ribosome biogenesis ATPase